jgi:hypothetical protein
MIALCSLPSNTNKSETRENYHQWISELPDDSGAIVQLSLYTVSQFNIITSFFSLSLRKFDRHLQDIRWKYWRCRRAKYKYLIEHVVMNWSSRWKSRMRIWRNIDDNARTMWKLTPKLRYFWKNSQKYNYRISSLPAFAFLSALRCPNLLE